MALPTDEMLWHDAKERRRAEEAPEAPAGEWSGLKAMRAVLDYESQGGAWVELDPASIPSPREFSATIGEGG